MVKDRKYKTGDLYCLANCSLLYDTL